MSDYGRRVASHRREKQWSLTTHNASHTEGSSPNSAMDAMGDLAVERIAGAVPRGLSSSHGLAQMNAIESYARAHAAGKHPEGWCYRAVKSYIVHCGYGLLHNVAVDLPGDNSQAHDFADHVDHIGPERLGLRKLSLHLPFDAPRGAIVLVNPGTPGTANPTAGDITIKGDGDVFYNDGEMHYGGRAAWPPRRGGVRAVYVPL